MKRSLAFLILLVGTAVQADPGAGRQAELLSLLTQDCGSCHGMTLKGGLGPALTPDRMASRSQAALTAIILNGVPDTPMPPWRGILSDQDAQWLASILRKGLPHGS